MIALSLGSVASYVLLGVSMGTQGFILSSVLPIGAFFWIRKSLKLKDGYIQLEFLNEKTAL